VFLDEIHSPTVKVPTEEDIANPDPESELIATVHAVPEWTEPYLAYLTRGELPQEEVIARQVIQRSKAYTIINGELDKRSTTGIFQRCVSLEEGCKILNEITQEIVVIMQVLGHW
jgi:hypothetical protein